MQRFTCPKCNSADIYCSTASPVSSDRVTLSEGTFAGRDASSVTRYACGQCGYLEYYLLAEADREFIRQNWDRADR